MKHGRLPGCFVCVYRWFKGSSRCNSESANTAKMPSVRKTDIFYASSLSELTIFPADAILVADCVFACVTMHILPGICSRLTGVFLEGAL